VSSSASSSHTPSVIRAQDGIAAQQRQTHFFWPNHTKPANRSFVSIHHSPLDLTSLWFSGRKPFQQKETENKEDLLTAGLAERPSLSVTCSFIFASSRLCVKTTPYHPPRASPPLISTRLPAQVRTRLQPDASVSSRAWAPESNTTGPTARTLRPLISTWLQPGDPGALACPSAVLTAFTTPNHHHHTSSPPFAVLASEREFLLFEVDPFGIAVGGETLN